MDSPSLDRIQKLSNQISDFISSIDPKPNTAEAVTAMITVCKCATELTSPKSIQLIKDLSKLSSALLKAHMLKDRMEKTN